jgi:hypothetical protein
MQLAILNSFLLLIIAIELGLLYIRMGQKK